MADMKIVRASVEDADALCEIFLGHIGLHPEYISHGEVQMGVGEGYVAEDGQFKARVSPLARHYWMKYIYGNLTDGQSSAVFKAVGDDLQIVGFCVAAITHDGAQPFGMLCDVLVKEACRGGGVGTALLEAAMAWFREKGIKDIYLESGLNNHAAHEYFMRRGFVKVSEIYKLM
jgi:ribosomal protein S18 acetylase RimI-like enzyme